MQNGLMWISIWRWFCLAIPKAVVLTSLEYKGFIKKQNQSFMSH